MSFSTMCPSLQERDCDMVTILFFVVPSVPNKRSMKPLAGDQSQCVEHPSIGIGGYTVNRRSSVVLVLLPKSTHRGWIHQKQPEWRQHRLNRLPLPHGHGSLRPSFSSSSLSPCTIRTPRLTLVSEGKPRLRLLNGSKAGIFESVVVHDRSPSSLVG